MLRGWVHSGFNVHRSRRMLPKEREDLERLAQYIIRNPFAAEKMQVNPSAGSIIYRSGINEKIHRNFEVCSPCDFMRIVALIDDKAVIARILRHLGLWEQGVRVVSPARAPPEIVDRVIPPSPLGYGGQAEPWLDVEDPPGWNPFPDYETEPVNLSAVALA